MDMNELSRIANAPMDRRNFFLLIFQTLAAIWGMTNYSAPTVVPTVGRVEPPSAKPNEPPYGGVWLEMMMENGEWVSINKVTEVEMSQEFIEMDVTVYGTKDWKDFIPGLKEFKVAALAPEPPLMERISKAMLVSSIPARVGLHGIGVYPMTAHTVTVDAARDEPLKMYLNATPSGDFKGVA
jgi:hypothetical protein